MTRRTGTSLVETVVVTALISIIGLALAYLYRSANVEFEHSSATMSMAQEARQTVARITPYASTAAPAYSTQNYFIYSPTGSIGPPTQTDPALYPNIYSLDFTTGTDFFSAAGQFASANSNNPRGTGPSFRYRIRFLTANEAAGQNGSLILEKLQGGSPIPPALPTADPTYPPRILGHGLTSVTFQCNGNAINVRVIMRNVQRNGQLFNGETARNTQGSSRTADPTAGGPRHQMAREFNLFSTVMIPYYTGR